jgi:TonB family protein
MLSARMDSFGGAVWGGHGPALRPPTPAKAQETVLKALLQEPWSQQRRNPWDWFASLAIHIAIVFALVIVPMYFTQVIDVHGLQATVLIAPAPPAAAPPPPPLAVHTVAARMVQRRIIPAKLVAPTVIPRRVLLVHEPGTPPEIGGVVGGIPGGQTGGILSGIIGGTSNNAVPAISPPPPVKKEREIVRVGGLVKPPRLLYGPPPHYPPLAQMAKIQGTVLIEAVIDEKGNVTNARAIEGHPFLIPEALRTVLQWKYEPTYLDGEPAAVRMVVTVHFSMR